MSHVIGQYTCTRCGGSGKWINPANPEDKRLCYTCDGAGRITATALAARRRKRNNSAPDFFAGVDIEEYPGEPTPVDSKFDPASLKPFIREEITNAEKDIKSWTRVELATLADSIEAKLLATLTTRLPQQIELTRNGVKLPEVSGHQHPAFSRLLRVATSRGVDGRVPNVWITGPAGSGKTTGARKLAEALNVPFFYNGALETKFEVIGYKDAGGNYHTTAFREAMEQPSVYLFDDIDSCDSNAPLLALNGALANGLITFPDAQIERHPDSIVIATANTWGMGATADYVGRTKLDGAFLDRFGAKIHWGYDEAFEVAISGNPDWTRHVQAARRAAHFAGLKVLITPRASIAGAAYIAAGFSFAEAAEMTYLAGLSADQRRIIQ